VTYLLHKSSHCWFDVGKYLLQLSSDVFFCFILAELAVTVKTLVKQKLKVFVDVHWWANGCVCVCVCVCVCFITWNI